MENSLESTCARHFFPRNFIKKETLAQLFFCEGCKLFKGTSFFTQWHHRLLTVNYFLKNLRLGCVTRFSILIWPNFFCLFYVVLFAGVTIHRWYTDYLFWKLHQETPALKSFLRKVYPKAGNFTKKNPIRSVSVLIAESFQGTFFTEHFLMAASIPTLCIAGRCSILRSSRPEEFCKKGVLRNFAKFTGKHLCQGLFFNKVAKACNLLKKSLRHRCFPVNFAKFPRTPFFTEHLWWLLLDFSGRKLKLGYLCLGYWSAIVKRNREMS